MEGAVSHAAMRCGAVVIGAQKRPTTQQKKGPCSKASRRQMHFQDRLSSSFRPCVCVQVLGPLSPKERELRRPDESLV